MVPRCGAHVGHRPLHSSCRQEISENGPDLDPNVEVIADLWDGENRCITRLPKAICALLNELSGIEKVVGGISGMRDYRPGGTPDYLVRRSLAVPSQNWIRLEAESSRMR